MNLTSAQLAALKADILADGTLNTIPPGSDGDFAIAAAYNALVAPDLFVYRTSVPVADIYDQIAWANLTPNQTAPDASASQQVSLAWQNRALLCQAKQFNVQLLLQGQVFINAAKTNVRAGLQDALTNVPSGADGIALLSAGWVSVRDNALARKATRIEKLFKTGASGASAQLAATMAVEGPIDGATIGGARSS